MALQAVRFSGYVQRGLPPYLHTMATNLALAARGPPEWLAAVKLSERAEQEATERKEPFAFLLYDTGHCYNRFAEGFARIRMATTVLAVERLPIANEPLPENLDQLKPKYIAAVPADPFDGAPLRYRRLEKGYLVYSIGRDLHDDGGREVPGDSTNAMIYPNIIASPPSFVRRYGLESNKPPPSPSPESDSMQSSKTTNTVSWRSNFLSNSSSTNAPAKLTYDLTFTVER
jgi:hypothetical protein